MAEPAAKKIRTEGSPPNGGSATTIVSTPVSTPAIPSTPTPIALSDLEWSPEGDRAGRFPTKKVVGILESPLRGGMFVNHQLPCGLSRSTTLSFCFTYEGKNFGLTAGHLADVGDTICAFVSGVPNDAQFYEHARIGEVVSKSLTTDSLVFEIDEGVDVEPLKLAKKSGLGDNEIVLPVPGEYTPPLNGKVLIGYGAQRRGAHGIVRTPNLGVQIGEYAYAGDIGIASEDVSKGLTDPGDCGTIFVDQSSHLYYFHQALVTREQGILKESFGVPLAKILACHTQLGGTVDQVRTGQATRQDSPLPLQPFKHGDSADKPGESVRYDMKEDFKTRVVEYPAKKAAAPAVSRSDIATSSNITLVAYPKTK